MTWKNKQYHEYRNRDLQWVIFKLLLGFVSVIIIIYFLKGYLNA